MNTFIPPFMAMDNLCGLDFQTPVFSFGIMVVNPDEVEQNNAVIAKAKEHGKNLATVVASL